MFIETLSSYFALKRGINPRRNENENNVQVMLNDVQFLYFNKTNNYNYT